jgi:hypothetical protein
VGSPKDLELTVITSGIDEEGRWIPTCVPEAKSVSHLLPTSAGVLSEKCSPKSCDYTFHPRLLLVSSPTGSWGWNRSKPCISSENPSKTCQHSLIIGPITTQCQSMDSRRGYVSIPSTARKFYHIYPAGRSNIPWNSLATEAGLRIFPTNCYIPCLQLSIETLANQSVVST